MAEFVLSQLPAGSHVVWARHVGFAPPLDSLQFAGVDTLRVTWRLRALATALTPVVVTATERIRNMRLAQFEDHRAHGMGKYLTPESWKGRDNATLEDVLSNTAPAVTVARHRAFSRHTGCEMTMWVDGLRIGSRGLDEFPVGDIMGVEVYRGAAETPLQYGGTGARCGVLVIWTR